MQYETKDESRTRTYPALLVYIVLAYVVSWVGVVPIALGLLPETWHIVGALGPACAALIVASYFGQRTELIQSLRIWPRGPLLWLFCLMPLWVGVLIALGMVSVGQPLGVKIAAVSATVILPSLLYGVLEEIGWRGFALPRLQARFHPLLATTLLTIVWAAWHLPMFFYRFSFSSSGMVIGFVVTLFFGAVLLSALYNLTDGSLPAVMLFHVANNLVSTASGDTFLAILSTAQIILAIWVLYNSKLTLYYRKR